VDLPALRPGPARREPAMTSGEPGGLNDACAAATSSGHMPRGPPPGPEAAATHGAGKSKGLHPV